MDEKIGSLTIDRAPRPTPRLEASPWAGVPGTQKEEVTMAKPEIKMKALKVFLHNDGRRLPVDSEYVLHSEKEALEHVTRGLGERVSPEASSDDPAVAAKPDLDKPWTLQISPEEYLKKWPDGPNSDHARAVLAQGDGDKAGDGDDDSTAPPAGT